ncbi:MAG: hypothetical protein FVQ79_06795 [Planctomycetes bacterium]|nr:hypothetical protein [Planctomycetota bacterium]
MAKDRTKHQQKIISNYYDNLDTIMLTKLQEMVTDLYLADSQAKTDRLWERAQKAMEKLKIKPAIIQHIMKSRSVTVLAKNLEQWLKAAPK